MQTYAVIYPLQSSKNIMMLYITISIYVYPYRYLSLYLYPYQSISHTCKVVWPSNSGKVPTWQWYHGLLQANSSSPKARSFVPKLLRAYLGWLTGHRFPTKVPRRQARFGNTSQWHSNIVSVIEWKSFLQETHVVCQAAVWLAQLFHSAHTARAREATCLWR